MNSSIESACRQVLKEYCENPLLYLREANIQSRLSQLILTAYDKADTVQVEIESNALGSKSVGVAKKLQLELKLWSDHEKLGRVDITILRNNAKFSCESSGPLDIVARIEVRHVEAVVEIKAAPSVNSSIPRKLKEDIIRLLRIQNLMIPIEAHFFYLDKSISMAGYTSKSIMPKNDWETDTEFEILNDEPRDENAHVVYVWNVNPLTGQARRRYARRPLAGA